MTFNNIISDKCKFNLHLFCALMLLVLLFPTLSQGAESQNLDFLQELDTAQTAIDRRIEENVNIQGRIESADGILLEVLNSRLEREWIKLLEQGNSFASLVVNQDSASPQYEENQARALDILARHWNLMEVALEELNSRIIFPDPDQSSAEQAAIFYRLFDIQTRVDRVIGLMLETFSLQESLGFDIEQTETNFVLKLRDRAVNTSVYLDISVDEANGINAGLSALPGNSELVAKLAIVNDRIVKGTKALELAIIRLEEKGIDTTEFRQQLITTTGKITTDFLNFSVIGGLLKGWGEVLIDSITTKGPGFLFQVFLFLIIVFGFRKLSKLIKKLTDHGLSKSNITLSKLLHGMIVASSGNVVFIIGILVALSQLGISLGPLLAGMGIAGFVIGFALQDTLSNFASGLMILFYKPFDVGDLVDLSGVFGTVDHMSLVNTTILTLDNQSIILPNSMIWGGVIKNVTAQKTRRVDLVFGISYDDSIEKTEEILHELVDQHELILLDPDPIVRMHELGDSSVNFVVRAWTKTEDYWTVYWDLLRSVKLRFDKEGISIPFPQSDVHLITQNNISNSGIDQEE